MANVLYIPYANPVAFVEANPVQYAQYLTKFSDDYLYFDTLLPWQDKIKYSQKWQTSDVIRIQVEANFNPLELRLINVYDNTILTAQASLKLPNRDLPGVFAYEFAMSLTGVPEGCYFLQMTNGNLSEVNLISNPIIVKAKHENTVLIEYRNSRFHLDVIYETGIIFGIRIEASFDLLKPGSNTVVYEDQKANPQILSSRPYRVFPLVVGGSYGVPDWIIDRLNVIFSHNDVKIDGKSFAKNSDAQFTFNAFDDYPLRGLTIDLREGVNRSSKIFSPGIDPNKRLLVTYQIETDFFGGLAGNNYTIPIVDTE